MANPFRNRVRCVAAVAARDPARSRRARLRPRVQLGGLRRCHLSRHAGTSARRSGWSTTCSSSPPPTPSTTIALFRAGTAAFEDGDAEEQAAALDAHADAIVAYVTKRFGVTTEGGAACIPARDGGVKIKQRVGVPYAFLALDYRCPEAGDAHVVRSELFPDSEELRARHEDDRHLRPRLQVRQRQPRGQAPVVLHAPVAAGALLGVLPPRRRAPLHRASTTSCSCWR